MSLNRIGTEIEALCDLFVGFQFGQKLQNLALARGEQVVAVFGAASPDLADVVFQINIRLTSGLKNVFPPCTDLMASIRLPSAESFSR